MLSSLCPHTRLIMGANTKVLDYYLMAKKAPEADFKDLNNSMIDVKNSDDKTQFKLFFTENYESMVKLATAILKDNSQAEDLVQEAFVKTFSAWWRIKKKDSAIFYLRKCVINLSYSHFRKLKSQREVQGRILAESKLNSGSNITDSPSMPPLLQAIAELPKKQRAAIILRYWFDAPESQIATALSCSIGTVKSQLAKARHNLAIKLESFQ
jgi:RNA polymerase sigma-70 factor (sigma-E family)